jgi:hypothetical protein
MFGFGIYDALIIAGFLGLQYFLSSRNNVYWGAIIPVLFVSWSTWMLLTARVDSILAYMLILIVGFIVLLMEWSEGRKSLREKRKKELAKMKSFDMK